jgi:hypothetical protein
MRATVTVSAWMGLCLLAACGSAPPPQVPAAPKPVVQAAPPPPDLSPVPVPASLVVSGRIARLSASLATVHGWTKLPMPQSEQVTELLTSEAVGPIVDLDQPVDFAVAVTGSGAKMKDLTAISAAVKDPEKVKATLSERYKLVPGDNGATLLQGLGKPRGKEEDEDTDDDGKPDREEEESARTCELAPAAGDAPVRMVCAWSPRALTELAPWLTRTASRAPSSGDLHVEVHMAPLQPTIAEQKRLLGMVVGSLLGSRMGMSSARELALAFGTDMADLAADLDGATLDVTLGDVGAQAALTLKLSGHSSAIGRVLTGRADRSGPAPAAFWQLPADADFAMFNRGIEEAELSKARALLLQLAGDLLADAGVKDPERKTIVDALGKLVTSSPVVYGSGLDETAVRRTLAAEKAISPGADPSERHEAMRQSLEALLGWRIAEVDEPPARIAGAIKELSAAIGRPSVAAAFKSKDVPLPSLRAVPVARGTGLPAAAQHYVLELHPTERKLAHAAHAAQVAPPARPAPPKKPVAPARPVQVHLYVVPQGDRTWIALGGDDVVTSARLATALASSGDKLSARGDLASLRDAKVGAGGFFTARGVPEGATQLALLFNPIAARDPWEAFEEAAQMPHRGVVPIVFSLTAEAGAGAPTPTLRLQVPRDAIEDVVTAILRHGGF